MRELLLGSWGTQFAALTQRDRLQLLAVVLVGITVVITLVFGVRGAGSGDSGGCSFDDSDGGACGD